jgi:hypothetical protein
MGCGKAIGAVGGVEAAKCEDTLGTTQERRKEEGGRRHQSRGGGKREEIDVY